YTVINVERKERKKRVITINCPYNCSLIGIRENRTLIVVNCPYNCSLIGVLLGKKKINDKLTANYTVINVEERKEEETYNCR
ncbi:MAG: hypothetical protein IKH44_15745, partial [Bacteroidales bacterium]|nr:hypothetical protein [Bacteroidales bacterium]